MELRHSEGTHEQCLFFDRDAGESPERLPRHGLLPPQASGRTRLLNPAPMCSTCRGMRRARRQITTVTRQLRLLTAPNFPYGNGLLRFRSPRPLVPFNRRSVDCETNKRKKTHENKWHEKFEKRIVKSLAGRVTELSRANPIPNNPMNGA